MTLKMVWSPTRPVTVACVTDLPCCAVCDIEITTSAPRRAKEMYCAVAQTRPRWKRLLKREHGCAEACAAEQEDMAERADAEVFGDAEGEGCASAVRTMGKKVGHARVVGQDSGWNGTRFADDVILGLVPRIPVVASGGYL